MRVYLKVAFLSLTLLFSSSCGSFSSPATPIAESTPTETAVVQSPVPSPDPGLRAATFTPAPTSLNMTGPYIVFQSESGTWITNPDGSFPTRVSEHEIRNDLRRAISPTGDRMALVIVNDQALDLVVVEIPSGETTTIATLISITTDETGSLWIEDPTSPQALATCAITDYDSVAWQPGDGRLLAFTGAINGSTADLYLYDTQTQEITQLTDGPSQAIFPTWSPDGKYVLHYGVSLVPPFGGGIGCSNRLDGVWAVQVSDGTVFTLPKPEGDVPHPTPFLGWQDDSHYLTYSGDGGCYSPYSVNVVSGETIPIMDFSYKYEIAQIPENGALLFAGEASCPNSPGEGIFLLSPGQTTPRRILNKRAYEIYWMPESNVFHAYPEALFSSDGKTHYDPPVYDHSYHPAVSRHGYQAWGVIENQRGRVLVKIPGGEWQTILDGSVDQLIWDPIAGRTLLIALRDGSLYAATYPVFVPRLMGNLGRHVHQAIWFP